MCVFYRGFTRLESACGCVCVFLRGCTRLEGVGVRVCVLERFSTVRVRSRCVCVRVLEGFYTVRGRRYVYVCFSRGVLHCLTA